MPVKNTLALAGLAFALALGVGQANAGTVTLNLSGKPSKAILGAFESGSEFFKTWDLSLSGLDPTTTLSQGDTVQVTLTLDDPLTVPASTDYTFYALYLFSSGFASVPTQTTGSMTFFDGGSQVATGSAVTGGFGAVDKTVSFTPPNNGAMTFDSVTLDFSIDELASPQTVDTAVFAYQLASPAVPEPGTWALILSGCGGLGLALRHRRRRIALA